LNVIILTSNSIRHKFFANQISKNVDKCMVISESKPDSFSTISGDLNATLIEKHFFERYETEKKVFHGNDTFLAKTLTIDYGKINSPKIIKQIKKFQPDAIIVFGSSILKEEIIKLVPSGKFLNMHLGISPYYRGSGTNFWPFVNNELSFVGATILHLDPGIDTGDIVTHVRSIIEKNDDVHSIGCKVIRKGSEIMIKILDKIKEGHSINREKQWKVSSERYYRMKDFDEKSLKKYHENMKNGMIEKFLQVKSTDIRLIEMKF
jgi:phosphoribosylglycinamide formyltransferase 1